MTNNTLKNLNYNPVTVGVVVGIFMLAYLFGPIDIIPDVVLGYGQIDDGLILAIGGIIEIINLIYGINYHKNSQEAEGQDYYGDTADDYGDFREL